MADISTHSTLTTGLVSYWELEETSGTRTDSHGSNDLTDNNTVTSGTGIIGNGADFTASNSESLSITDASQTGLDITGDISISFWVNIETDPVSSGAMFFIDKGNTGGASTRGYMVYIYESSGNIILRFQYWDNDGATRAEATNAITASTGLNHVVCTADVSVPSATIYVDGSSVATASVTSATAINNTTQNFQIGSESGGSISFFDGIIDEVGIWTKVLTTGEIADLYNSGSGLPYLSTASGPASLKTWDTVATANIKTINGVAIANVKTINTVT